MLDEFDIESYKPRPINPGLGFHEKEQGRQNSRSSLKTNLERRLDREHSLERADSLKAFYEMPSAGKKKEPVKVVAVARGVDGSSQFFAWLLDLLVIGVISSGTIIGLGFFAHIFGKTSMEMVILTFSRMDGLMGMGVLFGLTYLLYFTYGDISTSLGKKFFGVKLVAQSGKSPNTKMTFVRSLITLFSLSLLGIPALLDFQGKLSNTKIVRE